MNLVCLGKPYTLALSALFFIGCSETPSSSPSAYVAPDVKTEITPDPTDDHGEDLALMITGGTTATPAESINALLEQGMNMYSIGQQRAFSQLLGIEDESNQHTPIQNSPDVPASLQQMADQLLQQYKQQIGVDPDAKITEPKI